MGYINLERLKVRKRNSCASALFSLSDVQHPAVDKSHILNWPYVCKIDAELINLVFADTEENL